MRIRKCLIGLLFLILTQGVLAQYDPDKVCRVEEGKILIRLNKNWTHAQKLDIANLFDLDTVLVLDVYDGNKTMTTTKGTWKVTQQKEGWVELSKPLGAAPSPTGTGNVIIVDDRWINAEGINKRESDVFGINKFTFYKAFSYHNEDATFYLSRYLQAHQVYLSGTFNNWGTLQTPMTRTDSGWIVTLKLSPGQYLYKYIVDGKWIQDPFNKLQEDDENGGYNSVVFCYNYRFFLPGYSHNNSVFLAGSFNGWNRETLPMHRVSNGWALYLYLRDGTHAYKYIVDGNWILDPSNPITRPDGAGNKNSFMSIGDTFYFRLNGHLNVRKAIVAGNFNVWNQEELRMTKTKTGWELPYVLAPGNYQYKFILDGEWITDPANPYLAHEGGMENSLLVIKPDYIFVLEGHTNAKKVVVTGNFTGWNREDYQMHRQGSRWVFPVSLKPGKYLYKFIVDGNWIEDPANDQWETNEYGGKNSVLWIEP